MDTYQKMNKFRVSYDLLGSGRNYRHLLTEIRSSPHSQKVNRSVYDICTFESAQDLIRRLRRHMRPEDLLDVLIIVPA